MSTISTIPGKCKRCYACVRNCPVKAIKVKEGRAEIIHERCLACGTCVRVCALGAKWIESGTAFVWQLLSRYPRVIAVLDPVFPAAFDKVRPGQLVSALRKLGFSEVMEGAFGAELVSEEYQRLVKNNEKKTLITSHCPVIVAYIEKFYPHLISSLAPIVSPMIAMGRVIKWKYDPEAKMVYIGGCIAAKAEAIDEKVAGVVDAVLTFAELKEIFVTKGIDPSGEEVGQFSGPRPHLGRAFPLSGGLLKLAGLPSDLLQSETLVVKARGNISEAVYEFSKGKISPRFIDARLCQGCIGGPAVDNDLSLFIRQQIITNYIQCEADPPQTERDLAQYAGIDLSRRFTSRYAHLPQPTEEETNEILKQINRIKREDRLNCGACGYNSCLELAIGVYQGLAEIEMCWPYLLDRLEADREQLIHAEKMSSLGQIAAAIAHEINNPLAGILTYTQLLAKKVAGSTLDKGVALGYLAKMESELNHTSRTIRSLLDFARQSEPVLRTVDINQVIEQAISLLGHQAEIQKVKVVKDFNPASPKVIADFDQLRQVFVNLCLNAVQAMPNGGTLTLRTSPARDSQLKIDGLDTGCGIPKENLPKLFIPFFTTKEKGKGVGLGLAVVHGIISRHQGSIEVQSEVGRGTTFTVYLGARHEKYN